MKEPQQKGENTVEDSKEIENVFPVTIEESVMRASSVVAAEIREGSWTNKREESEDEKDGSCYPHMVAASIEQFAMEMILPCLLASGVPDDDEGPYRVFLATLLALRETIFLNYESVFNLGFSSKSISNLEKKSYNILATGLIVSALRRFQYNIYDEEKKDLNMLTENFLELVASYDSGSEEFASYLKKPLNESTIGITPGGQILEMEENKAWIESFNCCRENHPLLQKQGINNFSKLTSYARTVTPNACSMFLVEKTPIQQINQEFYSEVESKRLKVEDSIVQEHRIRVKGIVEEINKGHKDKFQNLPK